MIALNMLVYKHTNLITGRSYVGWTSRTLPERWNEHVRKANFGKERDLHFKRAIRKYGASSFTHEVLRHVETKQEALFYEIFYIKLFDSRVNGYNETDGGEGGSDRSRVYSLETRKKMSDSAKKRCTPEWRRQKSESMAGIVTHVGFKHTDETKEKIRLATLGNKKCLGRIISEETRKKMSDTKKARLSKQICLALSN